MSQSDTFSVAFVYQDSHIFRCLSQKRYSVSRYALFNNHRAFNIFRQESRKRGNNREANDEVNQSASRQGILGRRRIARMHVLPFSFPRKKIRIAITELVLFRKETTLAVERQNSRMLCCHSECRRLIFRFLLFGPESDARLNVRTTLPSSRRANRKRCRDFKMGYVRNKTPRKFAESPIKHRPNETEDLD